MGRIIKPKYLAAPLTDALKRSEPAITPEGWDQLSPISETRLLDS